MTTLYGIKNCDTVKKAKKWLDANGISYTFHDFRVDGLDEDKIETWLNNVEFDVLLNKRGTSYRQLEDDVKQNLTKDNAAKYFVDLPTLIKRPVLELDEQVIVGFKADNYQALFSK
ncbi:ArsC family reductase [Saccharobesus litoralis]|uniref:ArsC family reductase n=1 Tax=Saccharobesus litoralis TaxID=2172099 RepID=A0A2S0VTX4_9ALTE|nr:ArsC family reductase [Saccharobesus litoralis]AWB67659.1 ArsC family reductase [Saccharobesus litoralis]